MLQQALSITRHLSKLSKEERTAAIATMQASETRDARHIRLALAAWKAIPADQRPAAMALVEAEFKK